MSVFHNLQIEGQVHQIHNYEFVDETAMNAATGLTSDDLYKIAKLNNNSLWMLTAITPTWIEISGSSSVTAFTDLTDVPATYVGSSLYGVRVNAGETGLEFAPVSAGNSHTVEDAVTAAVTDVVQFQHNSTGTPAAGFGTGIAFEGESSTTPDQPMGRIATKWQVATHGSRYSSLHFGTYRQAALMESGVLVAASTAGVSGNARARGAVDFQGLRFAADQVAGGDYSVLIGGFSNKVTAGGDNSGIVSGTYNTIGALGLYGFIGGGSYNEVNNQYSAVVGGFTNIVGSQHGGILAGSTNTIGAAANYSSIVAGLNNTVTGASGQFSAVIAGSGNSVTNTLAVIAGGLSNSITAASGFIGGGNYNTVSFGYGAAFGLRALANLHAAIAFSGGRFSANGDAQTVLLNVRRQVTHTGANWYELYLDGGTGPARITVPSDTLFTFDILLSGATAGLAKGFGFAINGVIENDGGVTAILGTPNVTTLYDGDDVSYDARVSADDPNNALLIEVMDADSSGDIVKWVATVRLASVTAA